MNRTECGREEMFRQNVNVRAENHADDMIGNILGRSRVVAPADREMPRLQVAVQLIGEHEVQVFILEGDVFPQAFDGGHAFVGGVGILFGDRFHLRRQFHAELHVCLL